MLFSLKWTPGWQSILSDASVNVHTLIQLPLDKNSDAISAVQFSIEIVAAGAIMCSKSSPKKVTSPFSYRLLKNMLSHTKSFF